MKICFLFTSICLTCISGYSQTGITTSTPWEFIKGDSAVPYVYPIYGEQGKISKGNKPSARYKSATWKDTNGNLWLFGGQETSESGNDVGYLNDLWKYNPANNQWIFIKGSNTRNAEGVYGIINTPDSLNNPGARQGSATWIDNAGNLWLFGGRGFYSSSTGIPGILNDLWKYDIAANKWTWVNGDNAVAVHGIYGTIEVAAATNKPGAREEPVAWTDPSGKLWLFGGVGIDSTTYVYLNDLWKYDIVANSWTWMKGNKDTVASGGFIGHKGVYGVLNTASVNNNPGSRLRSHSWSDGSGNLWLFGGDGYGNSNGGWLNDLWQYNITSKMWKWVKGDSSVNNTGIYGTSEQESPSNNPGSRYAGVTWADGSGSLWLLGGYGYPASRNPNPNPVYTFGNLNDLWKYDTTSKNWTWMKGDSTINVLGTYGVLGTEALNNKPGARNAGVSWKDNSGNQWFFGGSGYSVSSSPDGPLNDLWKYNRSNNSWTWVKGDSISKVAGIYGEQGYVAQGNNPGARIESVSWKDKSGNMWLFGGFGFTIEGFGSSLKNDLWKYDVSAEQWIWMKGDSIRAAVASYGTKGVSAATNNPGPRNAPVTWTDSLGNLWLFGGAGLGRNPAPETYNSLNDLWKYNPLINQWTWVKGDSVTKAFADYGSIGIEASTNNPGARLRTMSWTDTNGNLWLFGGDGFIETGHGGWLNDLWKFDTTSKNWTWIKGDKTGNHAGVYGTPETENDNNKPGGRYASVTWADGTGNLWMHGGYGFAANGGQNNLNDLWRYNSNTNKWAYMKGSSTVNDPGVYGSKGIEDAANKPGARNGAVGWKDSNGNFWLFGGATGDAFTAFNDLWKYKISNNTWTWVKGDSEFNKAGKFGVRLKEDTSNTPGATWRSGVAATDGSGNFWLFGGTDNSANSAPVSLNTQLKYNPVSNAWTWIKGSIRATNQGVFGVKEQPDPLNKPGAKSGAVAWCDTAQNLWLFGGKDYDDILQGRYYADYSNDLWKYNSARAEWTWVKGDSVKNIFAGVYNVLPAPNNKPGAREKSTSWTDNNGKLWLFGGTYNLTGTAETKRRNDLWKYDPVTNLWSWVKGSSTTDAYGVYNDVQLSNNTPGAREGSVSWKDALGNLWLFGGYGNTASDSGYLNDLWKFDTASKNWTWIKGNNSKNVNGEYGTILIPNTTNKPGARKGSVSWVDNNGNFWLFGGVGYGESGGPGKLNDLWKYTPGGDWTWIKGDKTTNALGVYGTKGTAASSNKPGARDGAVAWKDVYGKFWLSGGNGYNASGNGYLNDCWRYDPGGDWTWVKGESSLNVSGNTSQPGARTNAISWTDSYGDLWLFGGYGSGTSGRGYLNDLWKIYSGTKYVFFRKGNWNTFYNWVDSLRPPKTITPGMHVIINHEIPGNCISDSTITLQQYGRLTVESQKALTINQGGFSNAGYVIGPGNLPGQVWFTGNQNDSLHSTGQITTPMVLFNKKLYLTGNTTTNSTIDLTGNSNLSNRSNAGSSSIELRGSDLNMGTSALIANSTSYVVTNTNGNNNVMGTLIREVGGSNSTVTFPIGVDANSYTPVTINNTGTPNNFSVGVTTGVLSAGTSGTPITAGVVDRTWFIQGGTFGGSNTTVTLQWNSSIERGFDRTNSYISHSLSCPLPDPPLCDNGIAFDAIAATAALGNEPYTQTRNNIAIATNSQIPYFPYFIVTSRRYSYTFTNTGGDENWSNPNNWMNSLKPPYGNTVSSNMDIIIDPTTGKCKFNGTLNIMPGGSVMVKSGKILEIIQQ